MMRMKKVSTKLTHFDKQGRSRMVDVTEKENTVREAVAKGDVYMKAETFNMIMDRKISKGDVLGVAQTAGIMGAKKTSELIPMCHPLNITSVEISFDPDEEAAKVGITACVKLSGKTGVEMEALTAVSAAALTIYDMCKAVDRGMKITNIRLIEKSGGKSGTYIREDDG